MYKPQFKPVRRLRDRYIYLNGNLDSCSSKRIFHKKMEIDSAELIERTNLEEEESKLSRTFFMFVYSVVFHFDEILFLYLTIPGVGIRLVDI